MTNALIGGWSQTSAVHVWIYPQCNVLPVTSVNYHVSCYNKVWALLKITTVFKHLFGLDKYLCLHYNCHWIQNHHYQLKIDDMVNKWQGMWRSLEEEEDALTPDLPPASQAWPAAWTWVWQLKPEKGTHVIFGYPTSCTVQFYLWKRGHCAWYSPSELESHPVCCHQCHQVQWRHVLMMMLLLMI